MMDEFVVKVVEANKLLGNANIIIYNENNEVLFPKEQAELLKCQMLLKGTDNEDNCFHDKGNDTFYTKKILFKDVDDKKYKIIIFNDVTKLVSGYNSKLMAIQEELTTDKVTGVKIRKQTDFLAANYIKKAKKNGEPFAVVWLDIDRFKGINDNFGHSIGDDALKMVAQTCKANIRTKIREDGTGGDIIGRVGGDEFIVILTNISKDVALRRVNEIKDFITEKVKKLDGGHVKLTCSFGLLYVDAEELNNIENAEKYLHDICVKADRAMYNAKEQGGNAIITFNENLKAIEELKLKNSRLN